jgi:hypothetical protein
MLLPAEMLPSLLHEDPSVRQFAIEYFAYAHDPAPLTTDDVWAAADRVRGDDRLTLIKYLSCFASTPASTARLLRELHSETDDNAFMHLCATLWRLPGEVVQTALADPKVTRRLPPIPRAELDLVVDLAGRSFDDLWRLAETCEVEIKDGMWLLKPTLFWVNRLSDALARFPEQAAARALGALLDAPSGRRARWEQAFAARVLRSVRHPGALVPLLALAGDARPFFFASDWAEDALVHLGTREVVAAAAAGFPAGGWFDRLAAHILGRVKRPESEQALVRLLAGASDAESCTQLGMALCELCTTSPEALDRLHALVSCCHFDPNCGSLDEALLTVCTLHGFQPVEAPTWKERMAIREASYRTPGEQ